MRAGPPEPVPLATSGWSSERGQSPEGFFRKPPSRLHAVVKVLKGRASTQLIAELLKALLLTAGRNEPPGTPQGLDVLRQLRDRLLKVAGRQLVGEDGVDDVLRQFLGQIHGHAA